MHKAFHAGILMGCALVACVLPALPWVRLNISPSLPRGLYRLHAVPDRLLVGQLVLLDVPASVRAWQRLPLLKPVAGVPGDTVCVVEDTLWINGASYGPVLRESGGNPLPLVIGCQVVQGGEIVVASRADHSLDSRYFGAVAQTAVRAVATPLFPWRAVHGK